MRPLIGDGNSGGNGNDDEGVTVITTGPSAPMYPSRMAGKAVTKVVHRCQDAKENQKLDLSECQLMHIPDAIYHLMRNTTILWCNVSANVLRKIPSKFAMKFTNITELNVSHNQLSGLPDEFSELRDLQHLDISHNYFVSLPRCIFKLSRLSNFSARKNYITDVDAARLSEVATLEEVDLRENPLNRISHQRLQKLPSGVAVQISEFREVNEFQDDDWSPESAGNSDATP